MTDDTEPLTAEEPRRVREVRIVGDVWDLCDEAGLPRWPATGVAGDRCHEFGHALARLLDRHDTTLDAERTARLEAERERDEARARVAELEAALRRERMRVEAVSDWCVMCLDARRDAPPDAGPGAEYWLREVMGQIRWALDTGDDGGDRG